MRPVVPLLLLAACSGPSDSAGVVWVDAEGKVVDGVVEFMGRLSYVDEDGYIWPLNPAGVGEEAFTLPIDEVDLWAWLDINLVYENEDCSGEMWAASGPDIPRRVYILTSRSGSPPPPSSYGAFFVAPDDYAPAYLTPTYSTFSGECAEASVTLQGLAPLSELLEVDLPPVTWTPPLHPEQL